MRIMKNGKTLTHRICMIALAICINLVGGQIALLLKLPIYLDSIGTVFIAAVFGPLYGMIPNVVSGLLMGMTIDIYSLYYAPVMLVMGLVMGALTSVTLRALLPALGKMGFNTREKRGE